MLRRRRKKRKKKKKRKKNAQAPKSEQWWPQTSLASCSSSSSSSAAAAAAAAAVLIPISSRRASKRIREFLGKKWGMESVGGGGYPSLRCVRVQRPWKGDQYADPQRNYAKRPVKLRDHMWLMTTCDHCNTQRKPCPMKGAEIQRTRRGMKILKYGKAYVPKVDSQRVEAQSPTPPTSSEGEEEQEEEDDSRRESPHHPATDPDTHSDPLTSDDAYDGFGHTYTSMEGSYADDDDEFDEEDDDDDRRSGNRLQANNAYNNASSPSSRIKASINSSSSSSRLPKSTIYHASSSGGFTSRSIRQDTADVQYPPARVPRPYLEGFPGARERDHALSEYGNAWTAKRVSEVDSEDEEESMMVGKKRARRA
ncbi:hypothetical protein CI109_100104 [Kwoniella shandongensis]|uniref:Uncharacterized protein n=1 Tax=Kwoniella shandongensis TaxID=1734106 RepID=A0A5M6BQC3_9TREE|nr:uncharacterized protein CI109_007490 [Kwoniella shandongensis]KAA5524190.1 hypothetical protein CI109_007490 [Kwoniella shandongensis]